MSKGKTAKTASKNNPLSRSEAKKFFWNEKQVIPVLFIGYNTKFMAAQFVDSGDMALDLEGHPIAWAKVKN